MSSKTEMSVRAAIVMLLVGGGATMAVLSCSRPRVLAEATSPDGMWSVVITARPALIGAGEIVAEVQGVTGDVVSAFVIGFDSPQECRKFIDSITFDSSEVARIGGDRYVLQKSTCFQCPQSTLGN